jgi:hypothetical protein
LLEKCVFSDTVGDALVGLPCDITANINSGSGSNEEDGGAEGPIGDDGRRLKQIEYHFARIEALEKMLALLDD